MRRRTLVVVSVLALALAVSASAAPLTPLVLGWEQFFKIDWQAGERRGRPVVYGHVANEWGMPAGSVRVLVDALDAGGNVVGQQVAWVPGIITPGTRAYFETPAPGPATSYRVSVFSFDWIQAGGDVDLK